VSPTPDARALPLIELIYRAAVIPDLWNEFLEALSDELGAPVIGMNLEVPGLPAVGRVYRVNSPERFGAVFTEYALRGEIPWDLSKVRGTRFHPGSELYPDADLLETDFYRDYMEPQGLSAPLGLVMGRVRGQLVATMGIYPRTEGRDLTVEDRVLLDTLAPHLSQAYSIHRRLRSQEHHREAAAEVIDRLPTGVIFIGGEGTLVSSNRAAERIFALEDGLATREGHPYATIPSSRHEFESALAGVLHRSEGGADASRVLRIPRPSGRRAFTALVTRLQAASEVGYARDAVAVIFVSDHDDHQEGTQELIVNLYGLTMAEAELAVLLCEGKTLEGAAAHRGVTLNTARSQLKRVFAKTGTSRQTDLVRLVLTGVTNLREANDASPRSV